MGRPTQVIEAFCCVHHADLGQHETMTIPCFPNLMYALSSGRLSASYGLCGGDVFLLNVTVSGDSYVCVDHPCHAGDVVDGSAENHRPSFLVSADQGFDCFVSFSLLRAAPVLAVS
jgi:hypothetical protein